jgi:DNA polymerase-3 subunit alpha
MRSSQEMIESFKDVPSAIENTQKIADMCNFDFKLGETKLPYFETPDGKTPDQYLEELCQESLSKKYGPLSRKEAKKRLDYETSVIKETGFASYFLIVQDFVRWAKDNRIVVGPGRGSAGGSIVSYLLNITTIDPLKHKLLFERFLNPERISMPDIDLDFTDRRRDEVINYVAEKYGHNRVAQIITFGTMAARAVVRDVGRALKINYSYCDRLAKMIPFGSSLQEALENVPEFRQIYDSDEQAQKIIDFSKKLEGCARHASTHACGVVISKDPLDEIVPLQHPTQNDEAIVTQYEMHAIEELGLLKMDFLGLKNLTIIEDTLTRIYAVKKKKINIENIPLDDKGVYKLLQEAQTTGIFQLESSGMKRYLKMLKPTKFEDIVAMVALYRPGPMQFIPDYIDRKNKKKKINYIHPKLKPILEDTQGICIFQEQLMQIARDLAGFSLAEADILRKAVGKKIKSLLIEQKEKFTEGMINNGLNKEVAKKIWEWVLPFARYGFNKSHSVAYAKIAYQTAYLKAHYPVEFMSALLTSEKTDIERIAFLIDECRDMNIEVLAPDINESYRNFSVVPGKKKIRFGLLAIKNVGSNIVETTLKERKENGKFKSFTDFISRIDTKDLNKKSLESLIKAGVFDKFEERNKLLTNIEESLSFNRESRQTKMNGQRSLFDSNPGSPKVNLKIRMKKEKPASNSQKALWEKELLGLYISAHPLMNLKKILEEKTISIKELKKETLPYKVRVGGIISSIKKILTKKGQPMLFVKLEDLTDKIEVVVFPTIIQTNPEAFQENKIVFISGRLQNRDQSPKIICESIEEILNKSVD